MDTETKQNIKSDLREAIEAVNTLMRIGKQSFVEDYKPSQAESLAMGLIRALGHDLDIMELASRYLEDMNYHRMSAIIDAMNKGNVSKAGEDSVLIRHVKNLNYLIKD